MTSSSALDAGRAAAAERRWADAYELLARVDATDGLAASDLDLLGTVALLRGEPPASVDALTRAYEAHLAGDDTAGAARSAGWLALHLIELGDFSRTVVWAARAMRLVSAMPEPGALAGFVRLAPAVAQLGSGNPAEARQEFEEVLAIAERHGDRELAVITMIGLGKSLIELGADRGGIRVLRPCHDRGRGRGGRAGADGRHLLRRDLRRDDGLRPGARRCMDERARSVVPRSARADHVQRAASCTPGCTAPDPGRLGGGVDRRRTRAVALPRGRLPGRLRCALPAGRARAAARRLPLRRGVLPAGR